MCFRRGEWRSQVEDDLHRLSNKISKLESRVGILEEQVAYIEDWEQRFSYTSSSGTLGNDYYHGLGYICKIGGVPIVETVSSAFTKFSIIRLDTLNEVSSTTATGSARSLHTTNKGLCFLQTSPSEAYFLSLDGENIVLNHIDGSLTVTQKKTVAVADYAVRMAIDWDGSDNIVLAWSVGGTATYVALWNISGASYTLLSTVSSKILDGMGYNSTESRVYFGTYFSSYERRYVPIGGGSTTTVESNSAGSHYYVGYEGMYIESSSDTLYLYDDSKSWDLSSYLGGSGRPAVILLDTSAYPYKVFLTDDEKFLELATGSTVTSVRSPSSSYWDNQAKEVPVRGPDWNYIPTNWRLPLGTVRNSRVVEWTITSNSEII